MLKTKIVAINIFQMQETYGLPYSNCYLIKFWRALSSSTVCPLRFLPFEVLQIKHVFKIIK